MCKDPQWELKIARLVKNTEQEDQASPGDAERDRAHSHTHTHTHRVAKGGDRKLTNTTSILRFEESLVA